MSGGIAAFWSTGSNSGGFEGTVLLLSLLLSGVLVVLAAAWLLPDTDATRNKGKEPR